MDAANILKPPLARGELRAIGATTLSEYRKYVEKDAALERRFQPVLLGEPSVEETIAILRGLKEKYEVHHGVRVADTALVAAARARQRPGIARTGRARGRQRRQPHGGGNRGHRRGRPALSVPAAGLEIRQPLPPATAGRRVTHAGR